jgi:glutamine amidotransferase
MADVVAVLNSDASLLRCQLHRLDQAVELSADPGDVMGLGYYENGRVLLRKRPLSEPSLSLEKAAPDVRSEIFMLSWHHAGANGFRESDTAPYRFRNWLFAGKGRLAPELVPPDLVSHLPPFLQRGLVQTSAHELAFFSALANIHTDGHPLDHLELDPEIVGQALGETIVQLDKRAEATGLPPPQTTAVLSNGRMIVAARRGRPLSYALLEGMMECPVCGIDRETGDRDPRVRAHRAVKAVAITTRTQKDGVQWIEVPDQHVLTVHRTLAVRVSPLPKA